jgi:hypothetical protein
MSRTVGPSVMKVAMMQTTPAEVGHKTRIPPCATSHTPRHDDNERPLPCRRSSALRIIDELQRVDDGLSLIPIADVRGNVCLMEMPSAGVGQFESLKSSKCLLQRFYGSCQGFRETSWIEFGFVGVD